MFTADQIVAHLIGDYILQSHWMATEKTKNSRAAAIHAISYTIPFILITQAVWPIMVIMVSHFLVDRFRLARYLVWFKNGAHLPITQTGYPDDVPVWLSTWLLIIADNTVHIVCNGLAIRFL
jgi:Protein of unknown function (DUF3307)